MLLHTLTCGLPLALDVFLPFSRLLSKSQCGLGRSFEMYTFQVHVVAPFPQYIWLPSLDSLAYLADGACKKI
jgi:hypothetical protein